VLSANEPAATGKRKGPGKWGRGKGGKKKAETAKPLTSDERGFFKETRSTDAGESRKKGKKRAKCREGAVEKEKVD